MNNLKSYIEEYLADNIVTACRQYDTIRAQLVRYMLLNNEERLDETKTYIDLAYEYCAKNGYYAKLTSEIIELAEDMFMVEVKSMDKTLQNAARFINAMGLISAYNDNVHTFLVSGNPIIKMMKYKLDENYDVEQISKDILAITDQFYDKDNLIYDSSKVIKIDEGVTCLIANYTIKNEYGLYTRAYIFIDLQGNVTSEQSTNLINKVMQTVKSYINNVFYDIIYQTDDDFLKILCNSPVMGITEFDYYSKYEDEIDSMDDEDDDYFDDEDDEDDGPSDIEDMVDDIIDNVVADWDSGYFDFKNVITNPILENRDRLLGLYHDIYMIYIKVRDYINHEHVNIHVMAEAWSMDEVKQSNNSSIACKCGFLLYYIYTLNYVTPNMANDINLYQALGRLNLTYDEGSAIVGVTLFHSNQFGIMNGTIEDNTICCDFTEVYSAASIFTDTTDGSIMERDDEVQLVTSGPILKDRDSLIKYSIMLRDKLLELYEKYKNIIDLSDFTIHVVHNGMLDKLSVMPLGIICAYYIIRISNLLPHLYSSVKENVNEQVKEFKTEVRVLNIPYEVICSIVGNEVIRHPDCDTVLSYLDEYVEDIIEVCIKKGYVE